MVDFPKFTIEEMLENGVHFGHKTRAWNPKMGSFIYVARNGLHIINLQKTVPLLFKALKIIDSLIQNKPNAKILFVGTKRQASDSIKEFALRCGQFYVNHRWLGGMLTNWPTISKSIATLKDLEKKIESTENTEEVKYSKKEILNFTRKKDKLEKVLGGIREMKGKVDLLFVIDINKEHIAIKEAQKLGIPIVAIVDTNCNPNGIDYIIPGNDDSRKAIKFYCNLISDVILHAMSKSLESSGISLERMRDGENASSVLSEITSKKDDVKKKDAKKDSVDSKTLNLKAASKISKKSNDTKVEKKVVDKSKETTSKSEDKSVEDQKSASDIKKDDKKVVVEVKNKKIDSKDS